MTFQWCPALEHLSRMNKEKSLRQPGLSQSRRMPQFAAIMSGTQCTPKIRLIRKYTVLTTKEGSEGA